MNPTLVARKNYVRRFANIAFGLATFLIAHQAYAEVGLVKVDGWEVFSYGRVGGFLSYVKGDGFPRDTFRPDPADPTGMMTIRTQTPFGGGIPINTANPIADPNMPLVQPRLESMRVRSGFLGNILGMGFRRQVTENTTVTGQIEMWSDIESNARRKYESMPVDVRQGFMRLEGGWGSLSVGRQLTLFSRGAATIDFLYGHGYGVGFPAAVDSTGPAAGHVGTGVLGPGFAGGMIYATPRLAGLQLSIALFDPVALQGAWDRTKYVRPEAELTYERTFGSVGKLHLFANGGYQKAYRIGEPDSTNATAYGAGYGARIEVGIFHLGLAGHYGQGLGLYYALETTEAAYDEQHRLRKSDGYYAQAQLALAKFDINAGTGIARIIALPTDNVPDVSGLTKSVIKHQLGISAALVYHWSPMVHFDIDYFRAQYAWYQGEKQNVNFVNAGVTMTW